MTSKTATAQAIYEQLEGQLSKERVTELLEAPKYEHMGDIAFPCFALASLQHQNPKLIAEVLAEQLREQCSSQFERVESVGPYVNMFYQKEEVATSVLSTIIEKGNAYGTQYEGDGKTITMDLSSPNIAKPFSMGHLRSTVIGSAIANLLEKCGYKVVRINYLGDWGTQFGKLIAAYTWWGEEEKVRLNPIQELLKLYVRFHREAEQDDALNNKGREWFQKLENGDAYATSLWEWFREESRKEFQNIYDLLGVSFDSYKSEAYHHPQTPAIITKLQEKGLLVRSEGAEVVSLDDYGMPPALIKKSDGTTLYTTRDLAAAVDRMETYHFTESLYVVGNEQSLHFEQLKAVLVKMGYEWADKLIHVPFGMMLRDGKKMSTRKGKVVFLQEVLEKAIQLAEANIEEKNPLLENKEIVARKVGVGAVIFHDIKHHRSNDIEFSYDDMLRFDGETAPYLQYTYARGCSLLAKGAPMPQTTSLLFAQDDMETMWPIIKLLQEFPDIIKASAGEYNPARLAKYLLQLAQSFNRFYTKVRVLEESTFQQTRITIVFAVTTVLKEGLRLLNIEAPTKM
ncbi:arginine--tRNA ligase [Pontibacillus salicampi]|uniref:Arginine--tRNA ligase n=1 Tax=Pontibacillus salicampi TaxID=1449801 RepID=A0ABV6LQZ0_9BACI